jgi:hypothetical protein
MGDYGKLGGTPGVQRRSCAGGYAGVVVLEQADEELSTALLASDCSCESRAYLPLSTCVILEQ